MNNHIGYVTLLVHNQDEACEFYTKKLGFVMVEGHQAPEGGWYWLTVAPSKNSPVVLTLMTPQAPEDSALVGKQSGSIPLLVLVTDDCQKTIDGYKKAGVTVIKEPTVEFWGTDALIKDLYGNIIDVCQPAEEK